MTADLEWQFQARQLPETLLGVMSSEMDTGALTLSYAHVRSLQEYVGYVRGLPRFPSELARWLSAPEGPINSVFILVVLFDNPELNQNSLMMFIRQLKEHAKSWDGLFAKNLQLSTELVAATLNITRTGSDILEACARTKVLGKRREAWNTLLESELTLLSPADRKIVSSLPMYVNAIKQQITAYSRQVECVRVEVTRFRDEARFQLIPETVKKTKELEKYMRPTTKDTSNATMVLIRLQQRIGDLSKQLQVLEALLRQLLTASSHFHSAWQSFSTYIEVSNEKLQQITTGQQLARFAIYFSQFLGLWSIIEQSAHEMRGNLTRLQS